MNPFELARLRANEARLVLAGQSVGESTKGYELVTKACKWWGLKILPVSQGSPLLNKADAVIRIAQKRIVVRKDLESPVKAFLIAHELGHFFLQQGGSPAFEVKVDTLLPTAEGSAAVQYVESYGPRERQELQANVFAREFLLSRELGKRLYLVDHKFASAIVADLELPLEVVRLQLVDALLLPFPPAVTASAVPTVPTEDQKPAVDSPHKFTLVEAGPGTGKTTTLLLRVRKLLTEGVLPSQIVILTFSNKAAGELVARLKASNIDGAERMWVGTFHSFGLEFLRKFGKQCGLSPQIKLLDKLGAMNLLDEVLPDLSLSEFDTLSDSLEWLPEVLDAITRCKDDLTTPATFRAEVAAHPSSDDVLQRKRVDTAELFEAYETQLRAKQAVDFNDLLGLAVQLLSAGDAVIEEYLQSIEHVFVDEYQDVNRASAQLVRSVAKHASTVWAVGDPNQAIYAFMGASNRNIREFELDFPDAKRIPLGANHRSYKEITDAFHKLSCFSPSGESAKLLQATKGASGVQPCVVDCSDGADEQSALAVRIEGLKNEVPYGQQAILVNSNDMALAVAKGLEMHGVPVLFLGNIYERPEVKELMRLTQLSVDNAGGLLGSDWRTPAFQIQYADLLKLRSKSLELPWWQRGAGDLSAQGQVALAKLNELTAPLRNMVSPWHALCHLLLEVDWLTAALCADSSQSAINARLSIWQFVHSCRSPDGLNQFPTIKNFRAKVVREIRLKLDKNVRNVPPEAEGLDAVRILTAHKSKGLEFDAVHLLEAKERKEREESQWPLIPEQLIARFIGQAEKDSAALQAHNLLYVAMSRARKYLTVYKREDQDLPASMSGICAPTVVERAAGAVAAQGPTQRDFRIQDASLYDLLYYKNGCPRRVELNHRIGRVGGGTPNVFQLIRSSQSRLVGGLVNGPEARTPAAVGQVIEAELRKSDLWDHRSRDRIVTQLTSVARAVGGLFDQGGTFNLPVPMRLGGATISVLANQVVDIGGRQLLRLLRTSNSSSDKTGQLLGVLMKSHKEATGKQLHLVGVLVGNGADIPSVNPRAPTITAYAEAVVSMRAGYFEAKPSPRSCPRCPYYLYCDQGQE